MWHAMWHTATHYLWGYVTGRAEEDWKAEPKRKVPADSASRFQLVRLDSESEVGTLGLPIAQLQLRLCFDLQEHRGNQHCIFPCIGNEFSCGPGQQANMSSQRASFRFAQLSRHLGGSAQLGEGEVVASHQVTMEETSARKESSVWQGVEQAPEGANPVLTELTLPFLSCVS